MADIAERVARGAAFLDEREWQAYDDLTAEWKRLIVARREAGAA